MKFTWIHNEILNDFYYICLSPPVPTTTQGGSIQGYKLKRGPAQVLVCVFFFGRVQTRMDCGLYGRERSRGETEAARKAI